MKTCRWLTAVAMMLAIPAAPAAAQDVPPLGISQNDRYLEAGGKPFFWLGDTAWLLFSRVSREETLHYLDTRAAQGFNVVQVMVLHTPLMTTSTGTPALVSGNPGQPHTTPGSDPAVTGEYDYWDHVDWVVDRAAERGIYLAMVPAWGSLADEKALTLDNVEPYGRFLAERYGDEANVIWLNGGDTRGEMNSLLWDRLGTTIKAVAPDQLMTFHPIGRTASSWHYHEASWLDFNMVQSGHRSYAQEGASSRSEDNWRFMAEDWARTPTRPTIDGEPSYENIPHGLHEVDQPRWQAADARRYAWWAVMAGAFGHTYGENNVMQFFTPGAPTANFEADTNWDEALAAPGATQMRHLRDLIEARPMLERVPDQSLITDNGERYERVLASRGGDYALAYTYTGRPFTMRLGQIAGDRVIARWYSPRDGSSTAIGSFANAGERRFDPPGEQQPGNDWVLVLDDAGAER